MRPRLFRCVYCNVIYAAFGSLAWAILGYKFSLGNSYELVIMNSFLLWSYTHLGTNPNDKMPLRKNPIQKMLAPTPKSPNTNQWHFTFQIYVMIVIPKDLQEIPLMFDCQITRYTTISKYCSFTQAVFVILIQRDILYCATVICITTVWWLERKREWSPSHRSKKNDCSSTKDENALPFYTKLVHANIVALNSPLIHV